FHRGHPTPVTSGRRGRFSITSPITPRVWKSDREGDGSGAAQRGSGLASVGERVRSTVVTRANGVGHGEGERGGRSVHGAEQGLPGDERAEGLRRRRSPRAAIRRA